LPLSHLKKYFSGIKKMTKKIKTREEIKKELLSIASIKGRGKDFNKIIVYLNRIDAEKLTKEDVDELKKLGLFIS
jgi:hypothetical protein